MFRQIAFRQASIASRVAYVPAARQFATTRVLQKSVIDLAKDVLDKVNKKTGEVLAGSMEKAEGAVPDVSVKEAMHKANKKTGEVLAGGMEAVEEVIPSKGEAKAHAREAANKAQAKGNELFEEGKDKAGEVKEQAQQKAGEVKDLAQQKAGEAKNKAEELKDKAGNAASHAEHKARVELNAAGYKDLQDKGKKIETEQNRPDDAV
jgi:hypothetical protein